MRLLMILITTSFVVACGSSERRDDNRVDESSIDEPTARQGESCSDMDCDDGLDCIEYYGIAGPSGPAFTSCEIPCSDNDSCPAGQSCVTIADGPGQVCRAAGQ